MPIGDFQQELAGSRELSFLCARPCRFGVGANELGVHDSCHNAEPQLAEKVPDIFSKNADTAFKVETMLNYYLFEEGGPLRSLVSPSPCST